MPFVVSTALSLLQLNEEDVLYELGCGDGRVMIAAAQHTPGLRCVGVEYDRVFVDRAVAAVAEAGLEDVVRVLHEDVQNVLMDDATAVFVYLVPQGMRAMAPRLLDLLARGGRVVAYMFSLPGINS